MDYHNKYKLAISIMTANRKAVLEEVLQKLLKPLYDRTGVIRGIWQL